MTSEAESYFTILAYLWLGSFIIGVFGFLYAGYWLRMFMKEITSFVNVIITLYEYEREQKERPD